MAESTDTDQEVETQWLSDYESSSASESEEELDQKSQRKEKWKFVQSFAENKKAEAVSFVKAKGFAKWFKSGTRAAVFRCTKMKHRTAQCNLRFKITDNDDNTVDVFTNGMPHSCQFAPKVLQTKEKIQPVVDKFVKLLFETGITGATTIHTKIVKQVRRQKLKAEDVPTIGQLKYLLEKLRVETYGSKNISLGELEDFLESYSDACLDVTELSADDPFVCGYKVELGINKLKEKSFWFVMSTKRLLKCASETDIISMDGTYKFTWAGYPAFVAGTVDHRKNFKPLAFGIISTENTKSYRGCLSVS